METEQRIKMLKLENPQLDYLLIVVLSSQVVLVVKNLPVNAGDARDVGLIPGSGRYPGVEYATHSSILSWRITWTGEPGRLQSMGP